MKISEILTELGGKNKVYSTDKNRCGKYAHCYGKAYDHLFAPFDREAELDIIEIGIEYGPSLEAWKRFFPNANVVGVDIEDKAVKKLPGIDYIISDVKDMKPEKPFDIVIDDGSHKLRDVKHVVENFELKVGGLMVIEDCQAPDHWFEAVRKRTKYSIELIDLRDLYNSRDDFMIALHNYGYNF